MVHVNVSDSCTSLAVCRHVRKLIVLSECLTVAGCSDTTCDVELLCNDVVPDSVDSVDVALVSCKSGNVSHTSVHVSSTYCVSYSLILLENRLVSLAVLVCTGSVSTLVKEELGLVEILLLACNEVELCKSHLCDLVTRNAYNLSVALADLAAYAVSVLDGDVKEIALSCSLIVSDGTLYHVTEVIELVAEVLYKLPTL